MAFKMRTTRPEAGNKYYIRKASGGYSKAIKGNPTDKKCDVLSNCVGYAYGRFNEIGNYGYCKYLAPVNAENFIQYKGSCEVGQTPKVGACMVWQGGATSKGSDGAGHVAIVEKVISPTEVYTSESGWGSKTPFFNRTRKKGSSGRWGFSSKYKFLGFIYNPAVKDEPQEETYTRGTYQTLYNVRVRTGAGIKFSQKKVKDLTKDGQRNATSTNKNSLAYYKKGTKFTALNIVKKSDKEVWAKTPSGYVNIVYNGAKNSKKI